MTAGVPPCYPSGMKPGALLTVVGALGVAGYFGYDYWQTEKRTKKAKVDNAKILADREARKLEPDTGVDRHPVAIDMPALAGLSLDQAKEVLTKAGFNLDKFKVLTDSECTYKDEKDMKPKGTICSQEPAPNIKAQPTARLEVTIEEDDYEEGGVGSPSAWKRMPKLDGMTESAAKAALRNKGFADDEFDFQHEQGCGAVGLVCRTTPEGLQRKIRGRQGDVYIGD